MIKLFRWYSKHRPEGTQNKDGIVKNYMSLFENINKIQSQVFNFQQTSPTGEQIYKFWSSSQKKGDGKPGNKKNLGDPSAKQDEESEERVTGSNSKADLEFQGHKETIDGELQEEADDKHHEHSFDINSLLGGKVGGSKKKHHHHHKKEVQITTLVSQKGKKAYGAIKQLDQKFQEEDIEKFMESMKCYYEENEIQWEDQFMEDMVAPVYTVDIDRGTCKGGNTTLYTLIIRCFAMQELKSKSLNDDLS